MTKLFKPIVVFLDNEPSQSREVFLKWFDITEPVNTTTEHFCITNMSRNGKKLYKYVVRNSRVHPHFYSKDCLNDALVYGYSDFIGDYTVDTMDRDMTATEHMKMREEYLKKANNVYIGELE